MGDWKFRLELFVNDLEKSVHFYQNILRLPQGAKSDTSVRFDAEDFSLLLSDQSILPETHYFSSEKWKQPKGTGVELVIVVPNIHQVYQHIQNEKYPIYENIKKQPWGMTDFRLVDPDGYYVRVTSKKEG